MRLSRTGVLHAEGDTGFACYCSATTRFTPARLRESKGEEASLGSRFWSTIIPERGSKLAPFSGLFAFDE
jgi:hypothetical protein